MALLTPVDMTLPEAAWRPLTLLYHMVLIFLMSSGVMEVAVIRHRWRVFYLVSKVTGLIGALLFLTWPQPFLAILFMPAFANGFVEPWCHLQSVRRNPMGPLKFLIVIGRLLRLSGAMLVSAEVLRPIALAAVPVGHGVFRMQVPVIIAMSVELCCWVEESLVILRVAPPFLSFLVGPLVFLQTVCFAVVTLWLPSANVPTEYLIPVLIGNCCTFGLYVCGVEASTFEALHNGPAEKPLEHHRSIARALHRKRPITREDVSKYFSESAADIADDIERGTMQVSISSDEALDGNPDRHFLEEFQVVCEDVVSTISNEQITCASV